MNCSPALMKHSGAGRRLHYERGELCLFIVKIKTPKVSLSFKKCGEEGGKKVWNIAEERPKEVKKYKCRGSGALVTGTDALTGRSPFWVPQQ